MTSSHPTRDLSPLAAAAARSLAALAPAAESLETSVDRSDLAAAVARGAFRPAEDERLKAWQGRFLSVRGALWEVIGDLSAAVGEDLASLSRRDEWRCFLLGYAAACLLVRLDRFLVEELATDPLVQRKLNEGDPSLDLPRKQFTAVHKSLSEPRTALLLRDAMRVAERQRSRLEALRDDPVAGPVARRLPELERSLDPRKRRFLKLLARYRDHSLRRRGASARQRGSFAVLESMGRMLSEMRGRRPRRVSPAVREEIAALLLPGDVVVTRHDDALTNHFLPGYWPHAALHVGSQDERRALGVELDEERESRWSAPVRFLEALKDGVLFRPLEETLAVDAVAVIRPRLSRSAIARGLSRAAAHEGKLYNFDFDFFRSDRLVCTEVVYRAYDGLEGFRLELRERAGRLTLAAEDLLDLALAGELFEPVCVFGARGCEGELVAGERAGAALAASYREDLQSG